MLAAGLQLSRSPAGRLSRRWGFALAPALAAPRRPVVQAGRKDERADQRKPDGEADGGGAAEAAAAKPAWVNDVVSRLDELKKGQAQQLAVSASIFEAAVRGSHADARGSLVVHSLGQLAQVCELPASPQDLQPALDALAQPDTLYCFRVQLVKLSKKSKAQVGKEEPFEAAVAAWYAAPAQPSSEAEWREEEAHAGKVLACFVPNSQPHSAFWLWRAICDAAARDSQSPGSRDALLSLLHVAPAPLAWQPDIALAGGLVDACQDEVEFNLPVLVSHTGAGATLTVEEVKLGATGVGSAKVQLRRIVRLIAWLHAVLGQPQPSYVASVVVPCTVRRDAQQRLGRLEEQLPVPQGHGAAHVTWRLSAA